MRGSDKIDSLENREENFSFLGFSMVKKLLEEARLPAIVTEEESISASTFYAHIEKSFVSVLPKIKKPIHGPPPVIRDSLKSIIVKKIFY